MSHLPCRGSADTAAGISAHPSRFERYESADISIAAGWSHDELAAPARLFSANGVRLGPDGRCWVAEVWGGSISSWDADRDEICIVSPTGGNLSGPDDFALGADGSIYVTEYLDASVAAIRPDGSYQVLFDESPKANGIMVDPTGRLFVDEFRDAGRLYELDPRMPSKPRVIAEFDQPNALDLGPDGRLYVQAAAAGAIFSVDPDTADTRLEFDGLGIPSAMKFDHDGRLVVTDYLRGEVVALDLDTRDRSTLVELETGLDNLCFDPRGRLYVSNAITCELVRLDRGRVDARSGAGFVGPYGMTATADGTLLVADDIRIAQVAIGSVPETLCDPSAPEWTHRIRDVAWTPTAVFAISTAGEVLRLDVYSGAAEILFTPTAGEEATAINKYREGAIVGTAHGVLLELRADGSVAPSRQSGLSAITDVACSGLTIVACDSTAGRVVVLDQSKDCVFDGFSAPEAVAASDDGAFVVETGARRIIWLTFANGNRKSVANGLPTGHPRPLPRRMRRSTATLLPDGSLAVGCDGDGSIRRFSRI